MPSTRATASSAENADFAARCEAQGITFVGPPAGAIERMGDKIAARQLAESVGVPVIPGSGDAVRLEQAAEVAGRVGYPVILKAAAGGGGRGMRLVPDAAVLRRTIGDASAEAQAAFGDGTVYVEKYLANARHVEIQVLFDQYGRGIQLGERDCTIQRRYQKLIEEAPAPALDDSTRTAMADAALQLCRAVGYRGAGTVEFLLDQDTTRFFFIEMNTRLQVEHPVTEMTRGIDLVTLQLRIAAGESLPPEVVDSRVLGHAIEFRLNAEDAKDDFRPAAGIVARWRPPLGPGVRVDSHCYPGYSVPPFYDSLLAKVIAWGASRSEAVARSRRALDELELVGLKTTLPFHRWILRNDEFLAARTSTGWVDSTWPGGTDMGRRVGLIDTTLRDGQQSLWATRMSTAMMLPILPAIDDVGYDSVELVSTVHFDVAVRYLREDPWERIRLVRARSAQDAPAHARHEPILQHLAVCCPTTWSSCSLAPAHTMASTSSG